MNKFFVFLLLITVSIANGQTYPESIELGILPTEYGEGMPPEEFLELEESIVRAIRNIPRFEILKDQEDYYDLEFGDDWTAQIIAIQKKGKASNVPYLLQIVFGDTEWTAEAVDVIRKKAVVKDGKETVPAKTERFWTHHAGLWVTLNLYKVETGELEQSLTFNTKKAPSKRQGTRTATNTKGIRNFKAAVRSAKPALLNNVITGLKKLAPFRVDLLEPIEQSSKAIERIGVGAGSYHGLKPKDKLYIYYENEHLINGKKVIREIYVGSLTVEEAKEKTAICKVKKGSKKLKKIMAEGKALKCAYKTFNSWAEGYGF